jgi:anti-anti-sigma factor
MQTRFVTQIEDGGVRVLALTLPEQLESSHFDEINDSLLGAIEANPSGAWVLDLADVTYMGSTLLGMMVNLRQRIRTANGQLALCGLSERLTAIFRACSLVNLFVICKTRQQAIHHLS